MYELRWPHGCILLQWTWEVGGVPEKIWSGQEKTKRFLSLLWAEYRLLYWLTLFKFGLHLSCSYSFIAPGKWSAVGCCRVKMRQKINSGNFRTSSFFLWKGLFNITLIGSYWYNWVIWTFFRAGKIHPASGWRHGPGYLKWRRNRF